MSHREIVVSREIYDSLASGKTSHIAGFPGHLSGLSGPVPEIRKGDSLCIVSRDNDGKVRTQSILATVSEVETYRHVFLDIGEEERRLETLFTVISLAYDRDARLVRWVAELEVDLAAARDRIAKLERGGGEASAGFDSFVAK